MKQKDLLIQARRLEELLAEAHAIASETGFVAPTLLAILKVMERNVSKNYHNQKDSK